MKKIVYISNYPVKYHRESLDYVTSALNIPTVELYMSDYCHPLSRYTINEETVKFIKKNITTNPNFFNPKLKIAIISDLFDKNTIVIFHGYDNINLLFYLFYLKIFTKVTLVFRGESTKNTSKVRNVFAKYILEKIKRFIINKFDILLYIGENNRNYYKELKLNKPMIRWPYARIDQNIILRRNNKNTILRFIFVGRLESVKGLDKFILNLNNYCELNGRKIELEIIGDGSLKELISDQSLNYEKKIKTNFYGWVDKDEIFKKMQSSDVFVLPSLYEPYGMVVAEAVLNGMPLLLSKYVGALPDFLEEGLNGFSFNPESNNELFSALDKIFYNFENNNLRYLSEQSILKAKQNNLDITVDEIRNYFKIQKNELWHT